MHEFRLVTPEELAAVVSAHETPPGEWCTACLKFGASNFGPCLTYRLAADLTAALKREQRVRAIDIDALIEYEKEAFRQGNRETEDAVGVLMQVRDHFRAALAGEGAAEQPVRLGSCCVKVGTDECQCTEPTNWGAADQSETAPYATSHRWTPGSSANPFDDGTRCHVMLARYVCPYSQEQHPPGPPEVIDVFGYRSAEPPRSQC